MDRRRKVELFEVIRRGYAAGPFRDAFSGTEFPLMRELWGKAGKSPREDLLLRRAMVIIPSSTFVPRQSLVRSFLCF
jgi:hypothetical protein